MAIFKYMGVAIPVLTFLAYAYSFAFEVGYANYFNYPVAMIGFSLSLIGSIASQSFYAFLLLAGFLQINLQYWPYTKRHVFLIVILSIMFYFAAALVSILWPDQIILAVMGGILIAFLGSRVLFRRIANKPTPDDDWPPSIYDARSRVQPGTIADHFLRSLGYDPMLFAVLLFMILPLLFYWNGVFAARAERQFFALQFDEQPYLLVRAFGGSYVIAPMDKAAESVSPRYRLIDAPSASAVHRIELPKFKIVR